MLKLLKDIARNTRGPVASIYYQGLDENRPRGIDVVEKSVVSYGGVQAGYLEKGCSWITLFIAMAPSLGFLGTVIGMVQAFDKIQQVGDISPTVCSRWYESRLDYNYLRFDRCFDSSGILQLRTC